MKAQKMKRELKHRMHNTVSPINIRLYWIVPEYSVHSFSLALTHSITPSFTHSLTHSLPCSYPDFHVVVLKTIRDQGRVEVRCQEPDKMEGHRFFDVHMSTQTETESKP